ncbi:hypothetical protein GQ600_8577 [Phytophthora cactorum]|nr:hypothetical protein GQ600_8577 [Phytophthora cactorum]
MMGVVDITDAKQYIDCFSWRPCVDLMMSMEHLRSLLQPKWQVNVFLKARRACQKAGDARLQIAALEHFSHSLVRHQHFVHISYMKLDNTERNYKTILKQDTSTITFARSVKSNTLEKSSVKVKRWRNTKR